MDYVKTCNDYLGAVSLLFEDSILRGWTVVNVTKSIRQEAVRGAEIGIFTPAEARTLLSSISAELRPAILAVLRLA